MHLVVRVRRCKSRDLDHRIEIYVRINVYVIDNREINHHHIKYTYAYMCVCKIK